MEQAAIEVGAELIAAKAEHPREFMRFVEDELPFGIDRAERLMSICRAFESADDELRGHLPAAYFALYQLARIPAEKLTEAIEAGEVHPQMTTREAEALARAAKEKDPPGQPISMPEPEPSPVRDPDHSADVIAEALMRQKVDRLSADMTRRLRQWLS